MFLQSASEHYNYFDDDGKFINKDNNDNYHDRWPGQDEWERDKEEYEKLEDCFLELVGGCSKLGYLSVCQEVLLSGLCHKEETII